MQTAHENIINVQQLEPRLRHQTIFNIFNQLNEGEHLIIHNNHDPMPVYYQLINLRGNIFSWEYLQKGPEWWDIKVTRRVPLIPSEKENEIILNIPAIEPHQKHALIFDVFENLPTGESYIIHDNHDPKPVFHQLQALHGDVFTWEYLQQGPQWWDIRVSKQTLEKNAAGEFDVRMLIPIQRHKSLIQLFRDLPVKESFVFINDHDPLPLFYEFRSIYGDVVGWEYLNRGGREWKVKVTRLEESKGVEFDGISTLLDLRKADKKEWKQIVFHRYGMMEQNTTMELISSEDPVEIHGIFVNKFEGRHKWIYKKKAVNEFVVHIIKQDNSGLGEDGFSVINEFDLRPFPPTERHEMFYKAFADIRPGEAFEFVNDHDPKPLYYQMEAESREPFRWEYLEKGPTDWKVRVVKVKN